MSTHGTGRCEKCKRVVSLVRNHGTLRFHHPFPISKWPTGVPVGEWCPNSGGKPASTLRKE